METMSHHKESVTSKSVASKKEKVTALFDRISNVYDLLNRLLSLGIDTLWRKKTIRLLHPFAPREILDVATGTGDFAIASLALDPVSVTGIDLSEGMLSVGRDKIAKKGLQDKISLQWGDSENIPFEENKFDAVIVAFGVRNFEKLEKGLREMLRVTRPGGAIAILEFSKPRSTPFKQLYGFYFNAILPRIGRWVSRHRVAYSYLPESVSAFPDGEDFVAILTGIGYKNVVCKPFTLGICSLYLAVK